MKDEYDFSDAEQGKFYRPLEELEIPIYLEGEVRDFFVQKTRSQNRPLSMSKIVNELLKKDIEISNQLSGSH